MPTKFLTLIIGWLAVTAHAQISIPAVDLPILEKFNTLASGGASGMTLPAGWVFLETGSGSNTTYTVDNGTSSANDTYSYGSSSSTERALGQLNGTTVSSTMGASFVNNAGINMTTLLIQYAGEQWRLGATGRTDKIDFQYSTNATAIDNGTWTDADALDFKAPITTGSIGALDGNLSANRMMIASTLTGLSIANGAVIWIRWNSFDATGNDDGLSIDDFAITANPVLHYTVNSNGAVMSITDTDGNGEALDVSQAGSNIRFYAAGRTYSLNGGATTPLPVDIAITGLTNITINAGTGNDTINVGAFATSLPSLTINGGINDDVVNMNGDINFVSGSFLNADLQNDNATPGTDVFNVATNANLACSGIGIATIKVSSNILLNSGSSIITANGNLILEANQQFTPTVGDFVGIEIYNALIQTTGTGTTTVKGVGGSVGTLNHGIQISGGGVIKAGSSGSMTIIGTGGVASGTGNRGVSISGAGSNITSSGAHVIVTGIGGGSSTSFANYGVHVISSATITAGGSGNVTITGTGGSATGGSNMGVWVGTAGTISSSGGNVSITGNGGGASGSGTLNYGVYVQGSGKITAGNLGTVTVIGTGGAAKGASNDGVGIWEANSIITSSGGNVNVTGYGGGDSGSASNVGVHLQLSGTLTAGGTGNVNVTGIGGANSGNSNFGIFVIDNGSSISSFEGNVTLNGIGGGLANSGNNYGIVVFGGQVSAGESGTLLMSGTGASSSGSNNVGIRISESTGLVTSGGGSITMTGMEGGGTDSYSILVHNSANVTTETNGGDITIIGNSMSIAANIKTDPDYNIQLYPFTNGVDINLGTANEIIGGPLQLSDAELDYLTTSTIFIGSIFAGTITLTSSITRSATTHMALVCNEDIIINGGNISTAGGDVLLDSGTSPYAIKDFHAGMDMSCGTLYPAGEIAIVISGNVADVSYTQLNVVGSINLTGIASLSVTGNYSPQPGEIFTIINNDGVDAILGTFTGLAEGAVLTSFLGSNYPATISYVGGTGNDVVITVSSPNYLLTTTGNQIVFTDLAGNGETITVSQDGPNNMMFAVPGRNYSWNGSAVTALPVSTSLAGMNMVTVNAGAGNDGITVDAFTATMCQLTLNGGIGNDLISMNGDLSFAANANLDIDLQNDVPVPGDDRIKISDGVHINILALGSATLKASQSIAFGNTSSLTTVDGNLTLEANQQAIPTTGSFYGVVFPNNSLVEITGTGILTVKGKGGTIGSSQMGVYLFNSAILKGGTTGTHTVSGTGGLTSGDHNRGVQVQLGAIITTNGGHLMVIGEGGGTGASNHNHGIHLVQGGVISAGDYGTVTIYAYGGLSTGIRNHGIHIFNAGSKITSSGANVYVNGFSGGSGASSYNHGVFVEDHAMITAGGFGIVNVQGYGGSAQGERNDGVICFQSGATITSSGGDVYVTGQGGGTGASFSNYGVLLENGGLINAGGLGNVHVNGTGGATTGNLNTGVYVYLANSMITSLGGDVQVTGQGGGAGSSNYNFGVYMQLGSMITAGNLGNVFVNGTAGVTTGTRNDGVCIENGAATITSSGGNVQVMGHGGGTGISFNNYGVFLNNVGLISAGGLGNVNVQGTGGLTSGGADIGVYLVGAGTLITSNGGNVHVTGQGGTTEGASSTSSNNIGIEVAASAIISAGSIGNVTVEGTGASTTGSNNYGVFIFNAAAKVSSSGGNIHIMAQGGGSGAGGSNIGFHLQSQGIIAAGGSGDILIEGHGGPAQGGGNHGALILHNGTSVTTVDGDIEIIGNGNGVSNAGSCFGIEINDGTIQAGGAGYVNLHGTGAMTIGGSNHGVRIAGTQGLVSASIGGIVITGVPGLNSNALGIQHISGAQIQTQNGDGNIALLANSMNIASVVTTPATDTVFISSFTTDTSLLLGAVSDVNLGPLSLSDTELDNITSGTLVIGTNTAGTISVVNNITRSVPTVVNFISQHDIIFDGGMLNTNVGNSKLAAGNSSAAVRPLQAGVDVSCDTLTFESDLAIRMNGTAPDVMYDQLTVHGVVDLTGVDLLLSGTYAPMQGDSFVIVLNDAVDPLIGEFIGLHEGDTLYNFMGSMLKAVITYHGNTGNDVVIRIPVICFLPDVPLLDADMDTICENTLIHLSVVSGELGSASAWHWYANACGGATVGTGNSIMVSPNITTTYYVRGEGGCVTNATCGQITVQVNPHPNAAFNHTFGSPCYYTNHTFQLVAAAIPGATYQWNFGLNAVPLTATGYGPHSVYYTAEGMKSVKLVIYPNAPGAQCPDSSALTFTVNSCPGQILGKVKGLPNVPIPIVAVKLFEDNNTDGLADNAVVVRNVLTGPAGLYAMSSLTPGSYVIVETQPNGWNSFSDGDLSFDGDIVGNVDTLDNLIPVTILPNEVDSMNNFIEIGVAGTITGTVFIDYDGDMVPDPDEGIPNVSLKLFNDNNIDGVADNGTPVMTQINNGVGNYSMTNIPTGNYVLVEINPVNMISVKDYDPTNDNDVVPNTNMNNDTIPVTITNNETDATNFFIDMPSCTHLVTNSNDAGPGSLRQAIDCAVNGDTIRFHNVMTGATINITSSLLDIGQNIVILSTLFPRLTITSQLDGLFVVQNSFTAEFKDVDIIGGTGGGSGGAAIDNFGILKLNGVNITRNPSFPLGQYLLLNHPMSSSFFAGSCVIRP